MRRKITILLPIGVVRMVVRIRLRCYGLLLFGCRFRCGFSYIVVEVGEAETNSRGGGFFFLNPVIFFSVSAML